MRFDVVSPPPRLVRIDPWIDSREEYLMLPLLEYVDKVKLAQRTVKPFPANPFFFF